MDLFTVSFGRIARVFMAFVLAVGLAACGGGGGGGSPQTDTDEDTTVPPAVTGQQINALSLTTDQGSSPKQIVSGPNFGLYVFEPSTGGKQMLVESSSGSEQARMIFDSNGQLTKIIDENSGYYIDVLFREDSSRVDFLVFDSSGTYREGYAMFLDGTEYKFADIAGIPAFDGQISGQMAATSGTGSFALIVPPGRDVKLVNVRNVPPAVQALIDGWVTASGPVPMSTLAPASLSRALKVGGLAMIGTAVYIAGTATAPVWFPAVGAAGVAMVASGFASNELAGWINNKFSSSDPFAQSMVDTVVGGLADPDQTTLAEWWQRASSAASGAASSAQSIIDAAKNSVTKFTSLSAFEDDVFDVDKTITSILPESTDKPPRVTVDVSGQAVFQDGTLYPISGTVDGTGKIAATGTAGTNQDLTIGGQLNTTSLSVSGTFTRGTETGTFTGQSESVGQCNVSQASGGQGTFTKVHFIGSGTGMLDYSYEAYSIPDGFTLSDATGVRFDTNGLVSGGDTLDLPGIVGSYVFVNVYAPQSGTAWNYSVGCIDTSNTSTGTGGGAATTLLSLSNLSGAVTASDWRNIQVPSGASQLTVSSSGGTGDMDLYVYDPSGNEVCASEAGGNTESCVINNPAAGAWMIESYGYAAYSGVSLTASTQ